MNLAALGEQNFANKPPGVFRWYEGLFAPYKERGAVSLLEIGIQEGHSMRTWRDWFGASAASLVGLDITARSFTGSSAGFERTIADQSRRDSLIQAIGSKEFDIIIDDGSHVCAHQQISLLMLFKHVRPGGVYIIEDLHTSDFNNPAARKFNDDVPDHTTVKMLQRMIRREYRSYVSMPGEIEYLARNTLDVAIHECAFRKSAYRRRWGASRQACIWKTEASR